MLEIKRDGGWGLLVLCSVVCSQTILGGICLSSGLFYVIFSVALDSNQIETTWLCSLPMTLWLVSSPVGSYLTNKYGCRKCAFIGGIIAGCGLTLGYFASSTGYLFFSHGFLTGLGFGINYTASMSVLNSYFDKYKTIATGIASIGHNTGLVIYAVLTIYLQKQYEWRGMLLILGGVAFHLCACACVMFPLTTAWGVCNSRHSVENVTTSSSKRRYINIKLYKKLPFTFFCVSNIFTNVGNGIYLLLLPSYSKDVGFTDRNYGTVLMVYGISNVIGKIVYSFLGHHPRIDETKLYSVSLAGSGIFIGLTPVFLTKTGMLFFAGCAGFFYSVTGALLQAVIYNIVGFEQFADGVGMSLPFKAIGNLIGGPLAGFLVSLSGEYTSSFYTSGICIIIASLFMIQPSFCQIQGDGRHLSSDIYKNHNMATSSHAEYQIPSDNRNSDEEVVMIS